MTQEGQRATTGITSDGEETPLIVIRPCRMGVSLVEALDTSRSFLTTGYLLKVECKDLEFQVGSLR